MCKIVGTVGHIDHGVTTLTEAVKEAERTYPISETHWLSDYFMPPPTRAERRKAARKAK